MHTVGILLTDMEERGSGHKRLVRLDASGVRAPGTGSAQRTALLDQPHGERARIGGSGRTG